MALEKKRTTRRESFSFHGVLRLLPALVLTGLLAACGGAEQDHAEGEHEHGEAGQGAAEHGDEGHGEEGHGDEGHGGGGAWSVTAWSEAHEVFAEIDPLSVGAVGEALVHVTRLDGFAPVAAGPVEVVLTYGSDGSGEQRAFRSGEPVSPGVFRVPIEPDRAGEADLSFRIPDSGGTAGSGMDILRGGRVRIGGTAGSNSAQEAAQLVAPAPKGAGDGGEPQSFLKEQQWRGDFATAWVRSGSMSSGARGLLTLRPAAGGESWISAPVGGALRSVDDWPYAGRSVRRGEVLFRLMPRVADERSLAALESEVEVLAAERRAAEARLDRLEELLELEAASRREVEEARTRAETADSRHAAAVRDLASARSLRGGGGGESFTLRSPFAGRVAEVTATPGATVGAGENLARVVQTDPLWVEAALDPADAREVESRGVRGLVLETEGGEPIRIEEGVKLVSAAPEVSRGTGKVNLLLEVAGRPDLKLGATLDGQVLHAGAREGIVIPSSAVLDDGGVSVVYLQLSGESFARQEVRVVVRQGDRLLVEGLSPGQRLVTRGGNSIRRASLMSSGAGHGHVH